MRGQNTRVGWRGWLFAAAKMFLSLSNFSRACATKILSHLPACSEVSIAKIFLGIPTSKYPKFRQSPHRIPCPGGCALELFWHFLTRACRWVRDPVWGSAKAQDFEAVLVMAAEARKKCAEANAQRAPAGDKAPKKRRVKAARVAEESTVRVFDLESAMASAPVQRVASIDD